MSIKLWDRETKEEHHEGQCGGDSRQDQRAESNKAVRQREKEREAVL